MRITRRPTIAGLRGLEEVAGVSTSTTSVTRPRRTVGGPPGADAVEVSEAARFRQRLRTEVANVDPTPRARIAELRSQIAAGSFQPASSAVAERLLAELTADLLA